LRARRPAEARGQLQKILAGGPDAEASWLLSRALLQEGAVAKALGAFKEAVSFADENPVLADPAPFVGSASCAGCYSNSSRRSKAPAMRRPSINSRRGDWRFQAPEESPPSDDEIKKR
ncbi:MAG: hypothetical protein WBC80_06115, partial [Isosphaeraceae bacterium]